MYLKEYVILDWGNGSVAKVLTTQADNLLISIILLKMLGVVVHASNVSLEAAEAGGCLGLMGSVRDSVSKK